MHLNLSIVYVIYILLAVNLNRIEKRITLDKFHFFLYL